MSSNFGDELNTVLWPRLLPDFFDDNPAIRFLGIGSVLDRRHPAQPVKLVAGSGYGGYEPRPRLDDRWIIHWVRGPRTAAMLGLPANLALGDPAVLVPPTLGIPGAEGPDIGFIPHFESMARGAWQLAADRAGVRLIDPRGPPSEILRAIGRCKLLLSEALHGVIVADALRVPWVAIRPRVRVHRAKWADWADTMGLRPRFHGLPASTLTEWAGSLPLGSWHAGQMWLDRRDRRLETVAVEGRGAGVGAGLVAEVGAGLVAEVGAGLVAGAAQALRRAARVSPQLSNDHVLDRCQSRMLDAVQAIRADPMLGLSRVTPPRSRLHTDTDSAYQLKLIG